MTTARGPWSRAVRWLFRRVAARRIARELDGLHVAGLERVKALAAGGPVLLAATHVSWWDGLVLLALDEALGTDGRALMDATNLARLPFFRWIGALPLDRGGSARARRGLRAAAGFLDRAGRAVWIFPQGRQRPAHVRPLGLERGVATLVRTAGVAVIPVALTYGFRSTERPAAVVAFGAPLSPASFSMERLEGEMVRLLAAADTFLDDGGGAFTPLVPTRGGSTESAWSTRVLAWLAGPA